MNIKDFFKHLGSNVPSSPAQDVPVTMMGADQAGQVKVMAFNASEVKTPWLCSKGHLMGLYLRENKKDGGHVTSLFLLRQAYEMNAVVPEAMIFAKITDGKVVCSICGNAREWKPERPLPIDPNHKHRRRA